jgi:hypothetical protein
MAAHNGYGGEWPHFVPVEHLDDIIRRAKEDITAWDVYFQSCSGSLMLFLPAARLRQMKQNPEITLRFMNSADSSQRLGALYLVYDYWGAVPLFASTCLYMAFHDPAKEVRGLALCCLPRLYDFVHDSRGQLGRLLKAVHTEDKTVIREIVEKGIAQAASALKKMDDWNLHEWQMVAGRVLDDMMVSVDRTEAFLDHAEERLRYVALLMLSSKWEPTPKAARVALEILKGGCADMRMKCAALQLLGTYYEKSCNADVGALIASIVRDGSEDRVVRRTAYFQLFWLRAIPSAGMPDASIVNSFPAGVDWGFIESFTTPKPPLRSREAGDGVP